MSSPVKTRHTAQADTVRDALQDAGGFRSAQDIYAALRGAGQTIGLSTVYRHLQSLADLGVADVIVTPDGETTYRYCQAQGSHHHHLVCRRCGRAEEVEGRAVEKWATTIAEKYGYTDVDHTLEVFGICAGCAAA
jgi:Fur family transcriptional regulator, ferric uptake regulator